MTQSRNLKNISRLENEIYKLKTKGYLKHISDSYNEIIVEIIGPKDTPYRNALLSLNINIPTDYPFKSPSIGFISKIFHPNIDESSGSICLDVLNQVWTPLYDLLTILEVFIPQLLTYPNPSDPLNTKAAQLFINDKKKFDSKAEEFVSKYCKLVSFKKEESSFSYSDSDLEFEDEYS